MRIIVSCGPTFEPLDKVRRLTNFSTGRLGIGLATFLHGQGHDVTLLKGYYSVCTEPCPISPLTFTTTADLLTHFERAAKEVGGYDAIFHAAAVSDFQFGRVYNRGENGSLLPLASGKFATRDGTLLAELIPTPKIISQLRPLFHSARIVGWKYEVDGTREDALELGRAQIARNQTDCCVVNGPAYGDGYGLVSGTTLQHCADATSLYAALHHAATNGQATGL